MRSNYYDNAPERIEITIGGKTIQGEFFNWRIDPESVPAGKYFYEAADFDGTGDICRIQYGVLVNFWGTIITSDPIPLEDNGRAYPDDVNYLGYCGYIEDEEYED